MLRIFKTKYFKMKCNGGNLEYNCLWSIYLIVIVQIPALSSLLHCYRCLALDCPASKETCNELRTFVVSQLRTLYFMEENLEPCPKVDNALGWKLLETEGPCCDTDASCPYATCTLGRLRVISQTDESSSNVVSHGTVLGCANVNLLKAMGDATRLNICYIQNINSTSKLKSKHYLSLEHCNQVTDSCYENNFCIDFKLSAVKPFQDTDSRATFNSVTLVAVITTTVFITFAIMATSWCRGALSKILSHSKHTEHVPITTDMEKPGNKVANAAESPNAVDKESNSAKKSSPDEIPDSLSGRSPISSVHRSPISLNHPTPISSDDPSPFPDDRTPISVSEICL